MEGGSIGFECETAEGREEEAESVGKSMTVVVDGGGKVVMVGSDIIVVGSTDDESGGPGVTVGSGGRVRITPPLASIEDDEVELTAQVPGVLGFVLQAPDVGGPPGKSNDKERRTRLNDELYVVVCVMDVSDAGLVFVIDSVSGDVTKGANDGPRAADTLAVDVIDVLSDNAGGWVEDGVIEEICDNDGPGDEETLVVGNADVVAETVSEVNEPEELGDPIVGPEVTLVVGSTDAVAETVSKVDEPGGLLTSDSVEVFGGPVNVGTLVNEASTKRRYTARRGIAGKPNPDSDLLYSVPLPLPHSLLFASVSVSVGASNLNGTLRAGSDKVGGGPSLASANQLLRQVRMQKLVPGMTSSGMSKNEGDHQGEVESMGYNGFSILTEMEYEGGIQESRERLDLHVLWVPSFNTCALSGD
ncbi:hypothetical protein B0H34DRAFT_675513 [Crassisporium funariophilum]|nr:hypothetical protein B0H34DRAFT_675513 [Crassisporium funariophilum]